ncbi:sugar transferase [Propioniciclava tarda]|nr:sugar transferase [Propioniciclava tarda]
MTRASLAAPVPAAVDPKQTTRAALTWYARYDLMLGASDAVLITLAVLAVSVWRFGEQLWLPVVGSELDYPLVSFIIALLWWVVLDARGSRDRGVVGHGLDEYRRVMNASLYTFSAVAITSYLFHVDLSRAYFLVLLPVGTALLLLGRWTCRQVLHRRRAIGGAFTPTIVVGAASEVPGVVRDLTRNRNAGYKPVAVAVPTAEVDAEELKNLELAGVPTIAISRLKSHLDEHRAGAVVVVPGLPRHKVRNLAWQLENSSVELMFLPSLVDVAGPRITVTQMQDVCLTRVALPRFTGWNYALKRLFDLAFSSLALLLLAPVLAVIAVLIKREDGGPILFRQTRVGLGGEEFVIHKFRSMHMDAEARLAALRDKSNADSPLFKLNADARMTQIGRVLRKYSLDELPQFWTVLKGQMSVVGPRPHLASELAQYPDEGLRRLLIKPGITGLWQVSGRSDLSFADAVRLDLRYVENWSLTGDLTIILRTIRTVLKSSGAY